jgi:hypothetical protein
MKQYDSLTVYVENISLAEDKFVISRTVYGIWDVLNQVGGVLQVVIQFFYFIFT